MDTARGEVIEAELSALIARRHDQRVKSDGERDREALWRASARAHHARRREQNRWEWVRFFDRMAKSHARLAQDYERRAEELCEEGRTA